MMDLHIHSEYSDGQNSAEDIIEKLKKNGFKTISITDHNSIKSCMHIVENNTDDFLMITGVEFYGKISTHGLHILGYNYRSDDKKLTDKIKFFKNERDKRFLARIEFFKNKYGITFEKSEIERILEKDEWLSGKQIKYLLEKQGYNFTQIDEMTKETEFRKIKHEKHIEVKECIDLILEAGGIPVLAHPTTLNKNNVELNLLVKELISYGLMGIEVYNPKNTQDEIKQYLEIAKKNLLLISGGSDYHKDGDSFFDKRENSSIDIIKYIKSKGINK